MTSLGLGGLLGLVVGGALVWLLDLTSQPAASLLVVAFSVAVVAAIVRLIPRRAALPVDDGAPKAREPGK